MIQKIISGGQTGVDRAALDFAIDNGIAHGGFCPKGRRSESGRIPDKYVLSEISTKGYPKRTLMNVQSSDGTLIIFKGSFFGRILRRIGGGTSQTVHFCEVYRKPVFIVDLGRKLKSEKFAKWVRENRIHVLNVAGPSERNHPGIGNWARATLSTLLDALEVK